MCVVHNLVPFEFLTIDLTQSLDDCSPVDSPTLVSW